MADTSVEHVEADNRVTCQVIDAPSSAGKSWPGARYAALAAAMALGLGGAAVGLADGLYLLHDRWLDEYSYSHGYLVFGLALWLGMTSLRAHSPSAIAPSVSGVALLTVSVVGYLLADLLDFSLARNVMLPPMMVALVMMVAGREAAWRVLPAAGFVYLAIPMWDFTIPLLQAMATLVVTSVLAATDVIAFIEGSQITTPAGSFEIGDACAGQRFFLVGLALSAFYGLCWYQRWRSRVLLMAIAGMVAVISNWVRVYSLIMIGHVTHMEHYLIAEDHFLFGWALFCVFMVPVLIMARRLEILEQSAVTATPVSRPDSMPALAGGGTFLAAGCLAFVLLSTPAWLVRKAEVPHAPAERNLVAPEGWREATVEGLWQPDFRRPHWLLRAAFSRGSHPTVDVFAAGYGHQRQESKLISTANSLHGGWQVAGSRVQKLPAEAGGFAITELELASYGERRVVWYRYIVGGHVTHGRLMAKALEVPALLQGRRDGAVLALSASCPTSCDAARSAMVEFATSSRRNLDSLLSPLAGAANKHTGVSD